ncbi:MAG: aryl-alcohol dehydrogenase-like predicted oxidoreductase [Myxococcota bacterium]
MGRIAAAAWLVTAVVSYYLLGGLLGKLIEGYDRAALSLLPAWLTLASVLASIALTAHWQQSLPTRSGSGDEAASGAPPSGRRRFLYGTLAAGGGIAATAFAALTRNSGWYTVTGKNIFMVSPPYKADVARDAWTGSRVSEYRRLGRTEARISDISLGSGSGTGGRQTVEVAREAIERGINYFDTAPDYSEAGSEQRLGEAMKGVRDQMFVATKFCLPTGHLAPGSSVNDYIEAVDGSLRRLQTDWVDLIHIHSCDSIERLLDENAHEAFDRLKEQGKARFLGVSTHTPNLEQIANVAIGSDRFDVMMLAYHYGAWPHLGEIIERAAANDIGVVAMKTLRGSMHKGLLTSRDERDSYTQASFKWVLSNPHVSGLVISLWESGQLDEFLYASGKRPSESDVAILDHYQELSLGSHCRPHCGVCLDQCPEGLPIHDVLRQRMYYENYGAEKEAIRGYAALSKQADVCTGCAAPCASACPYGIPIPDKMKETHDLLSLS